MRKNFQMFTIEEVKKEARRFQIGDTVLVEDENGRLTEAVVVRFYPHLVQYKRKDGRQFTADYLTASRAEMIEPSGFRIHDDQMDRDALLEGMEGKKAGIKDDKL